ncbi:DUF4333 domain-containing protein [Amycolatopsis acidicola]|uniref:DUF4333 domain-containing protein n=1 Tax=Amycolatopsis acidicola TaxID=2596893 RepID=A0A5N0UNI0_9PSEU|nr:DUF4333 domain-containing protein [Amycolatopsis acidicola]KAA9152179.1 DUF4333 domain-containing protein [Amycolatopsis acidicola]
MYSRARIMLVTAGVLVLAGCGGSADDQVTPSTAGATSSASVSPSASASPARIFDERALQDGVRQVLVQSYGLADVTNVRCPSDQAVQTGVSFDCEVTIGGAPKTVTLTVQGPDGTYQVAQPK